MDQHILERIRDEWNALPSGSTLSHVNSLIYRICNDDASTDIVPPAGGFRTYIDIKKSLVGYDQEVVAYIFLEIGKFLNVPHLLFLGYYEAGCFCLDNNSDPFAALEHLLNAYNLWFDDLSEYRYYGARGLVNLHLKNTDEAISCLDRAITLATLHDDCEYITMYYLNKGVAFREKYDLYHARNCYLAALKFAGKTTGSYSSTIRNNLSTIDMEISLVESGIEISPAKKIRFSLDPASRAEFIIRHHTAVHGVVRPSIQRIIFENRNVNECPFYKHQWLLANSGKKYEIMSGVGSGNAGIVYLVSDVENNEAQYALKVLLPSYRFKYSQAQLDRFEREIQLISTISHPNIIKLIDQGKVYGTIPFYVMKYYGQTLRQVINQQSLITIQSVLAIIDNIWQGIVCLHANNIIHRDLKPENIIVDNDIGIITDLGIALKETENTEVLTVTNDKLGSTRYMSPEQLENPHSITFQSDYYSFGVMLLELITGSPFVPTGSISRYVTLRGGRWKNNSIQPIVVLIEQLLRPNPVDRPAEVTITNSLQNIVNNYHSSEINI